MARNKPKKQPNDLGSFETRYVDISIPERDQVKSLVDRDGALLHDDMEQFLSDGWKISFSYSPSWSNWVVSITPKEVVDYPSNIVFIFRHVDFTVCCGYVRFFFGYLVENRDIRLEGSESQFEW